MLHDRASGTSLGECSLLLADAAVANAPKFRDDGAWQHPGTGTSRHVLPDNSFKQLQHSTTACGPVSFDQQQLRGSWGLLPSSRASESVPTIPHLRKSREDPPHWERRLPKAIHLKVVLFGGWELGGPQRRWLEIVLWLLWWRSLNKPHESWYARQEPCPNHLRYLSISWPCDWVDVPIALLGIFISIVGLIRQLGRKCISSQTWGGHQKHVVKFHWINPVDFFIARCMFHFSFNLDMGVKRLQGSRKISGITPFYWNIWFFVLFNCPIWNGCNVCVAIDIVFSLELKIPMGTHKL